MQTLLNYVFLILHTKAPTTPLVYGSKKANDTSGKCSLLLKHYKKYTHNLTDII